MRIINESLQRVSGLESFTENDDSGLYCKPYDLFRSWHGKTTTDWVKVVADPVPISSHKQAEQSGSPHSGFVSSYQYIITLSLYRVALPSILINENRHDLPRHDSGALPQLKLSEATKLCHTGSAEQMSH